MASEGSFFFNKRRSWRFQRNTNAQTKKKKEPSSINLSSKKRSGCTLLKRKGGASLVYHRANLEKILPTPIRAKKKGICGGPGGDVPVLEERSWSLALHRPGKKKKGTPTVGKSRASFGEKNSVGLKNSFSANYCRWRVKNSSQGKKPCGRKRDWLKFGEKKTGNPLLAGRKELNDAGKRAAARCMKTIP